MPQATSLLAPHPNFVESDPVVGATGVANAVAAVPGGRRVGQFGVVHVRAIDEQISRRRVVFNRRPCKRAKVDIRCWIWGNAYQHVVSQSSSFSPFQTTSWLIQMDRGHAPPGNRQSPCESGEQWSAVRNMEPTNTATTLGNSRSRATANESIDIQRSGRGASYSFGCNTCSRTSA